VNLTDIKSVLKRYILIYERMIHHGTITKGQDKVNGLLLKLKTDMERTGVVVRPDNRNINFWEFLSQDESVVEHCKYAILFVILARNVYHLVENASSIELRSTVEEIELFLHKIIHPKTKKEVGIRFAMDDSFGTLSFVSLL
jgi:hypothetical protein